MTRPIDLQLEDFRADLTRASKQVTDGMPELLYDLATGAVSEARSRAQSRADRRMAGAIEVSRSRDGADIELDDDRVPGALGQEFGAFHDRPRQTRRGTVRGWNQFPGHDPRGRILGPAIDESWADGDPFLDLIDDAVHPAFPD